jgi:hypothetical protein
MKGVIAVVVSVLLFRNPVTAKGMFGYLITVLGVILYSEVRGAAAGVKAAGVPVWVGVHRRTHTWHAPVQVPVPYLQCVLQGVA